MPYTLTSYDICCPGMERLRNRNEFILTASVDRDTNLHDIRDMLMSDIQSCDRFDGFDYDAAEAVVEAFIQTKRLPGWPTRGDKLTYMLETQDIEPADDGGEGCTLYLYVAHCTMEEADA